MEQNIRFRIVDRVVRILAIISIIIGCYWLVAWFSGLPDKMSAEWISAGKLTVKTNMALCQLLAGVSLLLTVLKTKKQFLLIIRTALSLIIFLIGALTLWEHLSGMDLGIDQMLASEPPGALGTESPNRMGLFGSLSMALIGLGFLLHVRDRISAASYIGLAVCLINLVPAVGYLLRIDVLYSLPKLTGIASPSVIAIISLGLGLILGGRGRGIINIFLQDNPGGMLLRRLLPAILVIPIIAAFFIMKGERSGLYDSFFGTGFLILSMVFLLMIFAIITARMMNHSDAVRRNFQSVIKENSERLEIALEAADLGTWSFDIRTGVAVHSLRHDQIFGYQELQPEWSYEISLKHMLPEFHPVVREAVSKALKTGKLSYEARILWPDGSIHWIEPTGRVQYNNNGDPVRMTGVVADITERKKSEESLRASEKRYSALFSNKINGMAQCKVIYDESGKPINYRILQINEAYERIIGIKKADIEGRLATEVFPDIRSYKVDYIGLYGKLALERSEIKFEEFFEASQQYLSIYAYSPEPGEFIAIFTDVTDRIKAEKALRNSENQYRELVNNARTIIIKMDTKGRLTFFNEFAQSFFGYTEDEILGKTALETIVPELDSTGRKLDELIQKIYDNPDKFSINVNENIKKNGERVWIEWHNKSLFDDHGKNIGHIAIGIDITERKKYHDALIAAQDRLNIALENGKIGLWEWDIKKDELHWDARTEKMFGIKPGSFGKTLKDFEDLVDEEDIPHIRKATENALGKGLPFETVFRTRPGNEGIRYISSKALVGRDNEGEPVNLTGVCFDVTGLKEDTEQVITKLNAELLRSNKELENFAYVASHDLQEPLRMVTSFTQLLSVQYGDKLDDNAKEYIKYAVEGSKRMYDLLNGLLVYSRIKTKGQDFTNVDLNGIIVKVKANLKLKLEETHASINHENLPRVNADQNQMIQLFQNLIENSVKFSREAPRITISSRQMGRQLIFSIKDNGIGIEPQYSDRIFGIFQRLHHRSEYDGMGVGLAICQRIVERHKGKIWVESQPGKGATFSFTIPTEN